MQLRVRYAACLTANGQAGKGAGKVVAARPDDCRCASNNANAALLLMQLPETVDSSMSFRAGEVTAPE